MNQVWYIYGAGGFGVEVLDILQETAAFKTSGCTPCFVVDEVTVSMVAGVNVCGVDTVPEGAWVTIGVGEPATRQKLFNKAQTKGWVLKSIVSPRAFVSDSAMLEDGVIIAPFVSIQARAHVAKNVAVNTAAIIGHDCRVEAHTGISSQVNLGGGVVVGEVSYIGMGAIIQEGLSVGHASIVGMGAVVHRSVPDAVVSLGHPARVARRNEDNQVFSSK